MTTRLLPHAPVSRALAAHPAARLPEDLMRKPKPEMTDEQALKEARRRWGTSGAVSVRSPSPHDRGGGRGRLARYRYSVGNHGLGKACTVKGMGHTWREAFDDARPLT